MAQDSTSPVKTTRALDDYVLLGRSGLRVSPLCLGALCERILGEFVSDKRSDVVIATKYTGNPTAMQKDKRFNPNQGGNHRKSLVENLDESLKRLNMSYVDILYIHFFEYRTPIEEFMRALDDALYIAASDIPSWALSRANTFAEVRGWSPFIGLQTRYNLLDRSLELDLQPACAELDIGILPWSIAADGFLTGKYTRESTTHPTSEYRNNAIAKYAKFEKNWKILDEVVAISKEIDRPPVQVALNWIEQKPGITSPIIGAKNVNQLEENIKSLEFKLTPEQMKRLDDVSKPDLPFPYSLTDQLDKFIGKNIQVPNKFAPIVNSYNYGKLF
ncbi:hypothetical protein RclHR1_01230003 [Rhizophagus clarus]|uniref:NADP-dependent oxidoreductase domain-containing protein n=1 Tax=Rhizophagus clarus TaxID=94130 RepID=A0A2Z6Q6S4_9GLOM|nr:hypothetical protein RclHR1_01230003 [Rhizophagus clarus]